MQHILVFFFFFLGGGGGKQKSTTVIRFLKPASYNNTFTFFITVTCHCNISCHFALGSITWKLKFPFPHRSNSCRETLHLCMTFAVQSSCDAMFTFPVRYPAHCNIFWRGWGGAKSTTVLRYLKPAPYNNTFTFLLP